MKNILKHGLPLVVAITLVAGTLYAAVQQVLRMDANDPQIQLAQDAASALGRGEPAASVVPARGIDLATSLAPFLIAYDDAGKVVASSARLRDQTPALPPGVLDYARAQGEDRVTWQPSPGVRIAAVVTRYTGPPAGYVLAGRSLREVEKREDQQLQLIGAGWAGTCLATLLAVALLEIVAANGGK